MDKIFIPRPGLDRNLLPPAEQFFRGEVERFRRKLLAKYVAGDFSEVPTAHLVAFLAQTRLVEKRLERELRRRDHER